MPANASWIAQKYALLGLFPSTADEHYETMAILADVWSLFSVILETLRTNAAGGVIPHPLHI